MSKLNCFTLTFCLLGSWSLNAVDGAADRQASAQIIGLYHRNGLAGIVVEDVLNTEGIPHVRLGDLSRLAESDLKGLILGDDSDVPAGEIKRFVEKGGTLWCLKPGGPLADALGLEQVGSQKDGYLNVSGHGASLVSYEGRLQLFGQSIHYKGGESLARLDPQVDFGGIIRVKRGRGTALVATFDLPTTLLTMLQSESACGKAVDVSKVKYDLGDAPQADLMRRLVVGLFLESIDVPVMRKWYFPAQYKAMLMPLGDQDGADFAQLSATLDLTKELETPYTLYVTPVHQPVSRQQFKILADGGMEFGLHPDFVSAGRKFTEDVFRAELKKAEIDLGCRFTGERSHSMRWGSFRETPTWAEKAGLQYDSILGAVMWPSKPPKNGYWLGTGLPFHFIDTDRVRRMDFLEIPAEGIDNLDFWTRPQYKVAYKPDAKRTFMAGLGLSEDKAFEVMKRVLDQAVEKYHTLWGYTWHPHYLAAKRLNRKEPPTDTHFRKCINYAKSRGIGLTGSNAMNEFWRAREKVSVRTVARNAPSATIEYRVSSETKLSSLTLIVPLRFHGKTASVTVNGSAKSCAHADLFGAEQAMWNVDVGPEEVSVAIRYE
jgi:hypothetical protein